MLLGVDNVYSEMFVSFKHLITYRYYKIPLDIFNTHLTCANGKILNIGIFFKLHINERKFIRTYIKLLIVIETFCRVLFSFPFL